MYAAHSGNSPTYINDIICSRRQSTLHQGLRSATTNNYVEPRLCTKFGEIAFSFVGPHACNQLPAALYATPNLKSFKKQLKTHLFNIAFSHWSFFKFYIHFYSMNYCNAPLAIFVNRAL